MRMDDGTFTSEESEFGSFAKPGVDPRDPDLVAYWKFNEGPGSFKVKDASNNGHDLSI